MSFDAQDGVGRSALELAVSSGKPWIANLIENQTVLTFYDNLFAQTLVSMIRKFANVASGSWLAYFGLFCTC